jgi:hypothetical protein
MRTVTSNITINGQNESRAGSVLFEDFAYLNFNFTRYNSNSEVDAAIANITYPFQGQTNTPDGLDVARTQVCGFLPTVLLYMSPTRNFALPCYKSCGTY